MAMVRKEISTNVTPLREPHITESAEGCIMDREYFQTAFYQKNNKDLCR